jgi:hypothetical protein
MRAEFTNQTELNPRNQMIRLSNTLGAQPARLSSTPLQPRGSHSLSETEAHKRIAAAVLYRLPIPHYFDTDYYVDQRDLDRVLEVIRQLGRRGLLKLDNAVGVNAD